MPPPLGYGLGLRPTHYQTIIDTKPAIDWFEVISENYLDNDGKPRNMLAQIKEQYPIIMHGVSLSVGTTDPLDTDYLHKLKALADWIDPPWFSDHLCFTGIAHQNTHDLLPVPYTEDALAHITGRIKQVQDYMERPFIIENPSSYLEFKSSTMHEWEFITRMVEEADCGLLLDVNNVYVSAFNHGLDAKEYLDALPLERVNQIHLAGHLNKGNHIIDTHDNHVIDEVWELYKYVIHKAGKEITTMVEWDANIPEFSVLQDEINKAKTMAQDAANHNLEGSRFKAEVSRCSAAKTEYDESLTTLHTAILSGDNDAANPTEWIPSKRNFSPADQLNVYISGYRYRLFDMVDEDYPVLRHYLGKEKMNHLLESFIEATPSTSYTVSHFVLRLPEYIKQSNCLGKQTEAAHEIATAEAAMSELFDAKNTAPLTQADLSNITPETFLNQTLKLRPAAKLFTFHYNIDPYITAYHEESPLDTLEQKPTHLLIYRDDETVWRLPLSERERNLLQTLNHSKTLEHALETLHTNDNTAEEELVAEFSELFPRWLHHKILSQ